MKQNPYVRYHRWESPLPIARWLVWMLGGVAVVSGVLAIQVATTNVPISDTRVQLTFLGLQLQRFLSPQPFTSIASLLTFGAGVVWLVWQHRAQRDLYARGVPGPTYTPGWAVGWWFVPFANFVMPFLSMRELLGRAGQPADGVSRPPRRDPGLAIWWLAYLASTALGAVGAFVVLGGVFSSLMDQIDRTSTPVVTVTADSLRTAQGWLVAGHLVRAGAALLAAWVVWTISTREDKAAPHLLPAGLGMSAAGIPPAGIPPRPDVW